MLTKLLQSSEQLRERHSQMEKMESTLTSHTKTKEVFECLAVGKCYRLPMEKRAINRQEVRVAELAVQKEREGRRAEGMELHQAELHLGAALPKAGADTRPKTKN